MIAVAGRVIMPDGVMSRVAVHIRGRRIVSISHSPRKGVTVIDAGDGYIAPGYIDIHIHGGAGADYMDGTPEAVRAANRAHLRRGTTTVFPTTTTGSPAEIARMLEACRKVQSKWRREDGARIGGVHLYGPYFAESKVGCHSVEGRRNPAAAEYGRYLADGLVRIATCAAELPGALAFYRAARRAGCLVTCGHSDAGWPEMERAYRAGMRHVDHFWCAMSSVPSVRARLGTPMRGSMEQFVIATPEMSTEVIADGQHLAPELLLYALRMIGPERLCLVTDANRAMGMPPGRYRFGPRDTGAWFESDGKVGFVPGSGLASSVVALDTMVRNMAAVDTKSRAVRMASLTPAKLTGIDQDYGTVEEGKVADLLVLDAELNVRKVLLAGRPVVL